MMEIANNNVPGIFYKITDEAGTVIDCNYGYEPLEYVHGSGTLLAAMEERLSGLKTGEYATFVLTPEQSYGVYNHSFVVSLNRDLFPVDPGLQPGSIVQMPHGHPAEVIEMLNDTVIVDSNHPLAGIDLHIEVSVVSIRVATGKELLSGTVQHNPWPCGADCACNINPLFPIR
jgi:FKBP-type peptidyl-prolyl cis-trans isomerase SlyD